MKKIMLRENRTKYRLVLSLLLTFILLLSLTACGEEQDQVVKSEGMCITLSREYQKSTLANATWYYTSPDGLAMGIKSSKDDIEKSGLEVSSAQNYAEAYIKANSIPGSPKVRTRNDYTYFQYSRRVSGTDYSYYSCIYDHGDYYWLVTFACYKELYNEYKADFVNSSNSVTFEE
jgi:hypothetical protein